MHIDAFWRLIQTYSSIFITLRKPHIFTTLPYSEPGYLKPCETLDRHIQNPAIVTAWKKSIHRVFSGPNMGKYRPKETAYLDTFHIVSQSNLFRRYSAIFRPGLNISFLSRVKFSAETRLRWTMWISDRRWEKNFFWKNILTSRVSVININLR